MEFINKIEIQGYVGQSALNRVGDSTVCRFSVVTEHAYNDKSGGIVVDCTWFNVTAWEGKKMPDLTDITKGKAIHVKGRVRAYKFTGSDGTVRSGWEILASEIEIVKE